RDFALSAPTAAASFDFDLANTTLAKLRRQAEDFIEGAGRESSESSIHYSVEARYMDQVWEIEVPLESGHFESERDVADFCSRFHEVHEELFAVADPTSEIEIITWRATVRCSM